LYLADFVDLVAKYGINLYAYPDSTQMYLHFCRSDTTVSTARLEDCIADIGLVDVCQPTLARHG